MIGKRQHSSPIPENLACEISVATSQVRVSGNRRRGRLYIQPARHCPFSLFSHSPSLILSNSFALQSLCFLISIYNCPNLLQIIIMLSLKKFQRQLVKAEQIFHHILKKVFLSRMFLIWCLIYKIVMLGEYISQYRNKNTFYIYYTTNTNAPKRKYLIIYKICMTS